MAKKLSSLFLPPLLLLAEQSRKVCWCKGACSSPPPQPAGNPYVCLCIVKTTLKIYGFFNGWPYLIFEVFSNF